MLVVIWPGEVIWITPPQLHMHLLVLFRAGILPTMTVGEPGAHGELVTGTQGMGVRTPKAAVVAEATVGFASDMHMPKSGILAIGLKSMMFAAGGPPTMVRLTGGTTRELGAIPKLHIIMAPATTCCGMSFDYHRTLNGSRRFSGQRLPQPRPFREGTTDGERLQPCSTKLAMPWFHISAWKTF
jgi:hypothetical protein